MRTVTFSDEKVYKALNDGFINTWINRNPKFHNCDLGEEKRIFDTSYECYSTKNFCTFFVTPDRQVLHYFSGYYSPLLFLQEIRFVQELQKKVCDAQGRLKKDAMAEYQRIHKEHAKAHEDDAKRIRKIKPPSAGSEGWADYKENQANYTQRKEYFIEGQAYLGQVHAALAKGDKKTKGPVMLEKVIKGYMGGNEFTEE